MSAQNLTLLTDLYELTMMQGYFETQANETVIFDMFFRENPNKGGYSIMAGLDQVIEYIKNLNFSYEDGGLSQRSGNLQRGLPPLSERIPFQRGYLCHPRGNCDLPTGASDQSCRRRSWKLSLLKPQFSRSPTISV